MNRPDSLKSLTLASAFEQFLESAPFARRTRESYTEDLASLLTFYGKAPVTVLTTEIVQAYLARQEALAPTTYNRQLAALRSFLGFLRVQGWQTDTLAFLNELIIASEQPCQPE
jgi:site-specific recombinase XerD